MNRPPAFFVAALAAGTLATPAAASDGADVRVRAACSGAGSALLRLRGDDGRIRVEFRLENRGRATTTWRIVVLRERRLAARTTVVTRARRTASVRRVLPDWFGRESFVVRAVSARGDTCTAAASV